MLKKSIVIFLVSMVPLIELRGAVPIAFSPLFNVTLPIPLIYVLVILGNILPMPFIYLFARKVWFGARIKNLLVNSLHFV